MSTAYTPEELTREAVDQLAGATVLDFGTNWCGYCQTAEPLVDADVAERLRLIDDGFRSRTVAEAFEYPPEWRTVTPERHMKIEDNKGRALSRSYSIKLWPTLVFLANGQEITRIVRPTDATEIKDAVEQIAAAV